MHLCLLASRATSEANSTSPCQNLVASGVGLVSFREDWLTQKRHLYEDHFIFYMHVCHAFKVFISFWRGIAFKLVMQLQKTSVFKAMKGCQYYMCL